MLPRIALSLFLAATLASPPAFLQREVYAMGTILRISALDSDYSRIEKSIQITEQTEQELSNWREDSPISKLNRQPPRSPFPLSESLCKVFQNVGFWRDQTEGAFDPAIGQILSVWGIHHEVRIPSKPEIQQALQQSGWNHEHFDPQRCEAIKDIDVWIDSGAFGKGEALDRVFRQIDWGETAVMLDFGGQIAVHGSRNWLIAIADPAHRKKESRLHFLLRQGSVSTSGGSEADQMVRGKRVGHIVDPRTGYPVASFGSVTVWRNSALEADILSTALYVMGPEKGFQYANAKQIAAAFLFSSHREILRTEEWKRLFPN